MLKENTCFVAVHRECLRTSIAQIMSLTFWKSSETNTQSLCYGDPTYENKIQI